MNTVSHNIQFLGEQPEIVGRICTGLVVQQFYEGNSLVD